MAIKQKVELLYLAENLTFMPKYTPLAFCLLFFLVFGCAKEENTTYSIQISKAPVREVK